MPDDERVGYYTVQRAKDGQFYFVLHAENGEPIATSEMYASKANATRGISSVQHNARTTDIRDET